MAQNGQFGEGLEGHHAIGRVNFSKLLVNCLYKGTWTPEGRRGLSFACGKQPTHP